MSDSTSSFADIKVTYHYDEHADEWVVRLHSSRGYSSLCGCPGEEEARVVAAALVAFCQMGDIVFLERLTPNNTIKSVRVSRKSLHEYLELKEFAKHAFNILDEFVK